MTWLKKCLIAIDHKVFGCYWETVEESRNYNAAGTIVDPRHCKVIQCRKCGKRQRGFYYERAWKWVWADDD